MRQAKVLFWDGVCPKPYDTHTLETEGLGGTEATVLRVARRLSVRGAGDGSAKVALWQHCREKGMTEISGLQYISGDGSCEFNPTHIVVLRSPLALPALREAFPDAKIYLWCHDLTTPDLARHSDLFEQLKVTLITVSDFHKQQTIESLRSMGYAGQYKVKRIYNPIDDDLRRDETPVDKNKLVFFSSPHKGLEKTLKVFEAARRFNPEFRLFVANPGYLPTPEIGCDGVINLGPLSQSHALRYVRGALCVLYPNDVFPETFGLVFAEANAVGTPVLAHHLGAAKEVLDHQDQITGRSIQECVEKLMHWHKGYRPCVVANPEFRLANVIRQWYNLLDD
jgi:glycosyltransferase involved in cell wall biosynthesis